MVLLAIVNWLQTNSDSVSQSLFCLLRVVARRTRSGLVGRLVTGQYSVRGSLLLFEHELALSGPGSPFHDFLEHLPSSNQIIHNFRV